MGVELSSGACASSALALATADMRAASMAAISADVG